MARDGHLILDSDLHTDTIMGMPARLRDPPDERNEWDRPGSWLGSGLNTGKAEIRKRSIRERRAKTTGDPT